MQEDVTTFRSESAASFLTFSFFIELAVLSGAFGFVGKERPRPLSSELPSLPFLSFSKSARRLRNSSGEVLNFEGKGLLHADTLNG